MKKAAASSLLIAVALVAFAVIAEAQQPAKIAKIGWLGARSAPRQGGYSTGALVEVQRTLRELGYVEGKNIEFESRYADNVLAKLPSLADELIRLKIDVLITPATPEAVAARNATKTIPIVFLNVSDPVADGLIDSLARPGGNITGFTTIGAVLAGKRLELLKETVPKLSRVAVLWDPQNQASAQQWKECQLPARELGLQLHSMEVSSADKLDNALNAAIKSRSTTLAVMQSALFGAVRKRIFAFAAKHRLPAIYRERDYVESGGLMSYGADQAEPYKRAASMVDKILKGTKPADLPVEQPTKFEFVVNLKTAKQIGLTIPPNVLARADKVIK
jgi:putative ABC transport system substrate-binding protein